MAKGNETATFGINLEGNAADAANTAATAMDSLRQRILAGQGALKDMQGNLRNLRGSTDEVRAAKDELKAKLDAERAAISSATLELLKQGKTYDQVGGDAKKLAVEKSKLADRMKNEAGEAKKLAEKLKAGEEQRATDRAKAFGAAISRAGGPVASLRDKLGALKEVAGEGGAGGAMSLLTLGVASAVAATVALVAAVGAATYALTKFVLRSADAARSAGLLREAAMGGNAQWGKNFGEQVNALAKKVPTAKAEIDKLGISLAKNNIGGQTWVDTLNAVTQASAALGDDAGNKLKEFVERGKQFQRFQINPQEMIGTGLNFNDVAEALAKSMKIGVAQARQALFEGRVKLADGAAALRAAVEKKVGGINLRQMLSLENLVVKLKESFDELTAGIDIEPILKGFKELASVFDLSTESGQALKQIVEVFGKELGSSITASTPLAKKFLYGLIIGAQELVIAYLRVRNSLRATFSDTKMLAGVDGIKVAMAAGKVAVYAITTAFLLLGAGVALAIAPFVALGVAVYDAVNAIQKAFTQAKAWIESIDWGATATSIIDGLVNGLKNGAGALKNAVIGLGEGVKKSFKEALGIHSPSTVFEEFGKHTTDGYAQGVEQNRGTAQRAVNAMVSTPSGGGSSAGGAPITINVTINASGNNAKETAAALSSGSLLDQITKAVIDAIHGAGVPVPA